MAFEDQGAHSSLVEMQLIIDGLSLSITQIGPDFLYLETATDHPAGNAVIVLTVDSSERKWRVSLPQGISKESNRVSLAHLI